MLRHDSRRLKGIHGYIPGNVRVDCQGQLDAPFFRTPDLSSRLGFTRCVGVFARLVKYPGVNITKLAKEEYRALVCVIFVYPPPHQQCESPRPCYSRANWEYLVKMTKKTMILLVLMCGLQLPKMRREAPISSHTASSYTIHPCKDPPIYIHRSLSVLQEALKV